MVFGYIRLRITKYIHMLTFAEVVFAKRVPIPYLMSVYGNKNEYTDG